MRDRIIKAERQITKVVQSRVLHYARSSWRFHTEGVVLAGHVLNFPI